MKTIAGATRITLGASATLETLLAAGTGTTTILTALRKLAIRADAAATSCTMAIGEAATSGHPPPTTSGLSFDCSQARAKTIRLYGSGYADVFQSVEE